MACCVSKSGFCQDIPQSPHLFLESHSLPYRLVALYTYPENKEESPCHILRASSCGSAFPACRSLSHALPKLLGSCAPVLAVCKYNACLGPWKMFPPGLPLVENKIQAGSALQVFCERNPSCSSPGWGTLRAGC